MLTVVALVGGVTAADAVVVGSPVAGAGLSVVLGRRKQKERERVGRRTAPFLYKVKRGAKTSQYLL